MTTSEMSASGKRPRDVASSTKPTGGSVDMVTAAGVLTAAARRSCLSATRFARA